MASDDVAVRRWIAWVVGLIVVILLVGLARWWTSPAVCASRRKEASLREDAERLKMLRYHDALREIDQIGEATDNIGIRGRCQNAIMLLALAEPNWYQTYR